MVFLNLYQFIYDIILVTLHFVICLRYMKKKITIHPKYSFLRSIVQDLPFDKQAVFAKHYAKESNTDPYCVYSSIRFFKNLNEIKNSLKGFFKSHFKLYRF